MKAHIGVDADSELVRSVVGTAATVNDETQADELLRAQRAEFVLRPLPKGQSGAPIRARRQE